MGESENKICFVIAPIGGENTEIRGRSDDILHYLIEPVVKEFGYEAVRADKISRPGLITTQILELVIKAPLVIADLTGQNPNVLYELAYRHAFHGHSILLLEEGESLPFDVKDLRTIWIKHGNWGNVEVAKKTLANHVQAIEDNPTEVHTPVSTVAMLSELKSGTDPSRKILGSLMEEIQAVQFELRELNTKLFGSRFIGAFPASLQHVPATGLKIPPPGYQQLPAHQMPEWLTRPIDLRGMPGAEPDEAPDAEPDDAP